MRKYIFLLAIIASAFGASAAGLVPESCTIGNRPVFHRIIDVGFNFDGAITVAANAAATVSADGIVYATGNITESNIPTEKRILGRAIITFDEPLILPKGRKYTLSVPEGVLMKEDSPSVTNEELLVEFEVPENLGQTRAVYEMGFTLERGSTMESTRYIGFYFSTETEEVEGGGEAVLYREGVPVRHYPLEVSWDWDLGYAGVDFGENINFEDGVSYSLKIPEGNVRSRYRDDITNAETEVSFVGAYIPSTSVPPLQYSWCSLFDEHFNDILGEVRFYYDIPVVLAENPVVRLCIPSEDRVVKEVVPTLDVDNNKWVLTADFENTPLDECKGYSIVIPEGTLVTASGDVRVNSSNVASLDSSQLRSCRDTKPVKPSVADGGVTVDGLAKDSLVCLYNASGQLMTRIIASGEALSIPVRESGIYFLSVGNSIHKIAVP